MQGRLKRRYQIHKELSRSSYFQGEIDVGELSRLGELLANSDSVIEADFEFRRSDFDLPMLSGKVQGNLEMECQRCLQAMVTPIQLDFKLLIDAPDDIVRDSCLDTVYSEDGFINFFEVVEDELILALPLVAMHEHDSCNKHWQVPESDLEPAVRENPFLILKDLKTTH
ncbi:MAG: YceD family protein [Gammaproteobacteria bacterium]|nr:YceD family protein [Gammaproteobacteria bacterium]